MDLRKKATKLLEEGEKSNARGVHVVRAGAEAMVTATAIAELGDSLNVVDRMSAEGDSFGCVFLDIPYVAIGTKGGGRDLFPMDTITPTQFGEFIQKIEKLLSSDTSPVVFMFTSGKSSKKQHDAYVSKLGEAGLKLCCHGSYEKLWKNGRPMNMGIYKMPKEHIYVYTRSGKLDVTEPSLDFSMSPDLKEYPTSKPYGMVHSIIRQLTETGSWVLDPFGGSGKVLQACIELNRMCHTIDSSERSYNGHLLPILEGR